jgi:hypothetical protein
MVFKIGDRVKLTADAKQNSCYKNWCNKVLIITHIALDKNDHPGFDTAVNQALYSFKFENGLNCPCSLYHYEIRRV